MSSSWRLLRSLPSQLGLDSATRTVVEGIENMPTSPSAHHEDEPGITSVVDGFACSSHADGSTLEVLGHTADVHDSAHPARESLGTHRTVDAVLLAGLQGASDSGTVMKCGTRGAKEVGLDRRDGTDLLLHIHWNGERAGENRGSR